MTISKRFEVKLNGESERIINGIPIKERSKYIRQSIIYYYHFSLENIKRGD